MINIDLIPASQRKNTAGALSLLFLGLPREVLLSVGGVVILLVVAVHAVLFSLMGVEGVKWTGHRTQWQMILSDKQNIDAIGAEVKSLKKRLAGIQGVVSPTGTGWSRRLNILSDNLPQGLWLRKIILEKGALVIEGTVISKNQNEVSRVGTVVANLKKDAFFMQDLVSIEVNSILKNKRGAVEVANFLITAKYK